MLAVMSNKESSWANMANNEINREGSQRASDISHCGENSSQALLELREEVKTLKERHKKDALELVDLRRTISKRKKSSILLRLKKLGKQAVKRPYFIIQSFLFLRKEKHEGTSVAIESLYHAKRSKKWNSGFLIAVSRELKKRGAKKAELEVLKEANRLSSSSSSMRALFWSSRRSGDFFLAKDIAKKLKFMYGTKPNAVQTAFLKKTEDLFLLDALFNESNSKKRLVTPIKNRIAYVLHNAQPYSSGGYATRGHGIAKGLKSIGYDLKAVCRPGFPFDLDEQFLQQELPEVQMVDGVEYSISSWPSRRGVPLAEYIENAADVLTTKFSKLKPEYIIAASNHVTAMPALIAAKRLGLPFFYEVRGFWEITRVSREPDFVNSLAYKLAVFYETEIAKNASHVFTLTSGMKALMISRGIDENSITLVPNSCNPEDFIPIKRNKTLAEELNIPDDVPVIGYIGTFVQYEGLDHLVEACGMLKQKTSNLDYS